MSVSLIPPSCVLLYFLSDLKGSAFSEVRERTLCRPGYNKDLCPGLSDQWKRLQLTGILGAKEKSRRTKGLGG